MLPTILGKMKSRVDLQVTCDKIPTDTKPQTREIDMKKTYNILVRKSGKRYGQLPSQDYPRDILDSKPVEFGSRKSAEAKILTMQAAPGYLALPAKYQPSYEVV